MKFKYKIVHQRLFILFLIIAAALWYINKLAYNYKTDIKIPIELTFDYNSQVWVENPKMKIKCIVEGKGNKLLRYIVGLEPKIHISVSSLALVAAREKDYLYSVSEESLMAALRVAQDGLQIYQIVDTIPWIKITPMENVTLPLVSSIQIDCEKQYMLMGGQVKLQPATIGVRLPVTMLDTLKVIHTERLTFHDKNQSFSGNVNLIIPFQVVPSDYQVRYFAEIENYTEQEYTLTVEAENLPEDKSAMCIPSSVKVLVKIPLSSFSTGNLIRPTAKIDYSDRAHNRSNLFRVKVENLPPGGSVTLIQPEFIEPFFISN